MDQKGKVAKPTSMVFQSIPNPTYNGDTASIITGTIDVCDLGAREDKNQSQRGVCQGATISRLLYNSSRLLPLESAHLGSSWTFTMTHHGRSDLLQHVKSINTREGAHRTSYYMSNFSQHSHVRPSMYSDSCQEL